MEKDVYLTGEGHRDGRAMLFADNRWPNLIAQGPLPSSKSGPWGTWPYPLSSLKNLSERG